jgi:hypothetical protein
MALRPAHRHIDRCKHEGIYAEGCASAWNRAGSRPHVVRLDRRRSGHGLHDGCCCLFRDSARLDGGSLSRYWWLSEQWPIDHGPCVVSMLKIVGIARSLCILVVGQLVSASVLRAGGCTSLQTQFVVGGFGIRRHAAGGRPRAQPDLTTGDGSVEWTELNASWGTATFHRSFLRPSQHVTWRGITRRCTRHGSLFNQPQTRGPRCRKRRVARPSFSALPVSATSGA